MAARLNDRFQVLLFGADEPLHVPFQKKGVNEPAERSSPFESVAHERPALVRMELMGVRQRAKRAAHHLIHEDMRRLDLDDLRSEAMPEAEVATLEGHQVAELEEAGHSSRFDQALAGKRGAPGVNGDIASEIEAELDRRSNDGVDDDPGHATAARSMSVDTPGLFRLPSRVRESEAGSTMIWATCWMSSSVTASICAMISSGVNCRPK